MADVGELDFAVVGIYRQADKHAKALLERGRLAAGNVVDVETAVVDKLASRSSVADLGDSAGLYISSRLLKCRS